MAALLSFLVKDDSEFILGVDDFRNQEERLNLISKNKNLISVLENYFENMWEKAAKIPKRSIK
jgi:hypothetical protein